MNNNDYMNNTESQFWMNIKTECTQILCMQSVGNKNQGWWNQNCGVGCILSGVRVHKNIPTPNFTRNKAKVDPCWTIHEGKIKAFQRLKQHHKLIIYY